MMHALSSVERKAPFESARGDALRRTPGRREAARTRAALSLTDGANTRRTPNVLGLRKSVSTTSEGAAMVKRVLVSAVVVFLVACTRPMPPAPAATPTLGGVATADPNVTTVPTCSPCLYDTLCRRVIDSDNDRPTVCCEPIVRMVTWFRGSTREPLVNGTCITADERAMVHKCATHEAEHGVRLRPGRLSSGGYDLGDIDDTFEGYASPENPCVAADTGGD